MKYLVIKGHKHINFKVIEDWIREKTRLGHYDKKKGHYVDEFVCGYVIEVKVKKVKP